MADDRIEPGMRPGAEDITCPYGCAGEPNIQREGHEMTLLGSLSPTVDPNHHWLYCRCLACGREFTKEWRMDRVCYSVLQAAKQPKLLRGAPVCWERFDNDPRPKGDASCP